MSRACHHSRLVSANVLLPLPDHVPIPHCRCRLRRPGHAGRYRAVHLRRHSARAGAAGPAQHRRQGALALTAAVWFAVVLAARPPTPSTLIAASGLAALMLGAWAATLSGFFPISDTWG